MSTLNICWHSEKPKSDFCAHSRTETRHQRHFQPCVAERIPIRNAPTPPIRCINTHWLELLERSCDYVKLKISTHLTYFFCLFSLLFVDGWSSYLMYCCLQQQYVKYLLLYWYCLLQQWSAVIVASRQYHFWLFLFLFCFVFVIFWRAYLAVHVCGARFQCHTCNSIYLGYRGGGGGPIWLYTFVVLDFSATRVTPSMWAIGGGLFGHMHLWCQILVPHV